VDYTEEDMVEAIRLVKEEDYPVRSKFTGVC
jgi:hypothetical protein